MKNAYIYAAIICLFLLCFSIEAMAQHNFRFSSPKTLVPAGQNPVHPDIAWDGNNFAVVYDDYFWSNNSSAVYLILVNTNGQVVKGPIKISSKKYAFHPKIVWTGNAYGIVYGAGEKQGNVLQVKMYLARYNVAGNKLSEQKLAGDSDYERPAQLTKLIWTGKKFGIFYTADPNKIYTYANERPLFCTADSSGKPGSILQIFHYSVDAFDVAWDGKQYVVVGSDTYSGWQSEGVIQVLVLNENGTVTKRKSVIAFAAMDYCVGASIIPLKKKNRYLLAIGNTRPTETMGPAAVQKISDIYGSQIRLKKAGISGLAPKNITRNEAENCVNPTLIRAGNNTYMISNCGSGCSFTFAKINDNGLITSTPLHYDFGG